MKLTYNNRREDFIQLVRTRRSEDLSMRGWVQLEQLVMFLVAGAIGLMVIVKGSDGTWAAVGSGIVVAFLVGLAIHLTFKSREVWYYPKEASLPGLTEIEMLDDAIVRRRNDGEQRWYASAVRGIFLAPHRATVFLGDRPYEGISIAREAVTDGDFDEFVGLLEQHWQDWQKLKAQA